MKLIVVYSAALLMASAASASPRPDVLPIDDGKAESSMDRVKRATIVMTTGGKCEDGGLCEAGYFDAKGSYKVITKKLPECSKKANNKDCHFQVDRDTGIPIEPVQHFLAKGKCGKKPGECVAKYKTSKLSLSKSVTQIVAMCQPQGGYETMEGRECSFWVDQQPKPPKDPNAGKPDQGKAK